MTPTAPEATEPLGVTPITSLADLLAVDGVSEEMEIRSAVGVLAIHGGGLERATDVVAREVAARTGSSFYTLVQPDGSRRHLPSIRFIPGVSEKLDSFLREVDTVM